MSTAVEIKGLTVRYGDIKALDDIWLEVKDGDYLGIIGPNGSGKTTLLKAMLGLVETCSGSVRVYGEKPPGTSFLTGYVPQMSVLDRNFPVSVFEVVLSGRLGPGLKLMHRYSRKDMAYTEEMLVKTGIHDLKNRRISDLSGGEFQKMLIARALAVKPKLLLLDEPTANVDAKARDQIYSLLGELGKMITIVLVTHDLLAISESVRSLACLNAKLVYHGEARFDEEVVRAVYGCPIDLIAHGVPHRVLREHETEE